MTRIFRTLFALVSLCISAGLASAQTPPTPAQAQAAMADPAVRARILAQVRASGMTQDQIRARLKAAGYTDEIISQLLGTAGVDTLAAVSDDVFGAVRTLGVMDSTALDSLQAASSGRAQSRMAANRLLLDSLALVIDNDTVRSAVRRLLTSPSARRSSIDSGFSLFGRELFERTSRQFDPAVNGPLPPDYRVGFGDRFMLVLTGDVARTEELTVTRDGWVVVRDAGQIPVANLTFDQLRSTLSSRLGRVYSGIGKGSTQASVLPMRVGTNQVFVLGDVASPNAYLVSRLGTVLTALYAAGGPSANGDARAVEVKRDNKVIATLDLYDYLLSGSSDSDVRLENGDVVFVRPRGARVRVTGAVVRPATYEVRPNESLADVIRMAGGFLPEAERRRVQIERIVPASDRGRTGTDKEVLDITSPLLASGYGPTTQKLEPGDVVRIFYIPEAISNRIEVQGNVFQPASVAFVPGLRLSQALTRAGGLKPDTHVGSILVSRLESDSSRRMIRVTLRSDGTPIEDIDLAPNDIVRAFSSTEFRTERHITVGGAVRHPRQIPFQEGMTLRDAVMLSGGLEESALLTHAEIGRLPSDRSNGVTATTITAQLDSTYLFERGPDGKYLGPPGVPVPAARVSEVVLKPYDAISILRQPDFQYQRVVSLTGRVRYPGTFVLKNKAERLSDLIERAGGLTTDADSAAIIFMRDSVGRVGVDLPRVLKDPDYVDNLLLFNGDSIFIRAYSPIVMVRGAVNSPTSAVAFVKGADIDYYIRAAGGGTAKADLKKAFVTQPSGKVETRHRTALLYKAVPQPQAGAIVQVPQEDPTARRRDWALITQVAVSTLATLTTTALLIINAK
jgi:polysaccharide export outer membrane protein